MIVLCKTWLFIIVVAIVFVNKQFYVHCQVVNNDTSIMTMSTITENDLQCLSELPVEQLLKIRKSLQEVSYMIEPPNDSSEFSERIGDQSDIYGPISSGGVLLNDFGNETISALPLMIDKMK